MTIMPYSSIIDLLDDFHSHFPKHARELYQDSYDKAWNEYKGWKDRKAKAHKIAWRAVEDKYEKGDDGNWHEKS